MRVLAIIAYDGSKFFGFQRQKNINITIVEQIEIALKSLNINSKVIGSGRTDRGVHAVGQVIHFDLPLFWQKKSLKDLQYNINIKLKYIEFKSIRVVDNSFHAQYSAKLRVYRYILKLKKPTIFEKEYVSYEELNSIELFKKAIKQFNGTHNFKFLKKEGSPTTTDIRVIYKTKVVKLQNYLIIYFYADGYLRSQVRLMIAAALSVANYKISLEELQEQIETKKKYITKPADGAGLYLYKVEYSLS